MADEIAAQGGQQGSLWPTRIQWTGVRSVSIARHISPPPQRNKLNSTRSLRRAASSPIRLCDHNAKECSASSRSNWSRQSPAVGIVPQSHGHPREPEVRTVAISVILASSTRTSTANISAVTQAWPPLRFDAQPRLGRETETLSDGSMLAPTSLRRLACSTRRGGQKQSEN